MKDLIVLIGDSLTFGYGIDKNKSWPVRLSTEYNFNILNKAINGNTSTDILYRFTVDVISKNPNTIFIMAGTNDFLSNRHLNYVIENIELMIKESLSITNNIIIGIPPTIIKDTACSKFMKTDTYDYAIESLYLLKSNLINLCSKYSIKYLDLHTISLNNLDNDIFLDGIHFNEKGNNFILEEFIKLLN